MSANVTDSRGLFLVKRARHEGPTYTAVLLKDVTVSPTMPSTSPSARSKLMSSMTTACAPAGPSVVCRSRTDKIALFASLPFHLRPACE